MPSSGSVPDRFAAAILAAVPPPPPGQITDRIALDGRAAPRAGIALSARSSSSARSSTGPGSATPTSAGSSRRSRESFFAPIQTFPVDPRTLIFALGELPYITGLYERGRRELTPDDNLSVDGVKEMVLDARERLREKHPKIAAADHAAAALGLSSATSATCRCSTGG